MNISAITVDAIEIKGAPSLDPIRVITQDLGPGQGRIIIECFGQSWGSYWGGMGDRQIRKFFVECPAEYLVMNLSRPIDRTKKQRAYLTRIVAAVQECLSGLIDT